MSFANDAQAGYFAGGNWKVPDELNYSTVKPEGLPSRNIEVRYKPSTQQVINPGETVQFLITTNGFWDPHHCFINITVDFSTLPNDVIAQIDGSAASFFRTLQIYCRGCSLETMTEWDVIVNCLLDTKLPVHRRMTHTHEGVGYGQYSDSTFGKYQNGLGVFAQKSFIFSQEMTNLANTYTNSPTLASSGQYGSIDSVTHVLYTGLRFDKLDFNTDVVAGVPAGYNFTQINSLYEDLGASGTNFQYASYVHGGHVPPIVADAGSPIFNCETFLQVAGSYLPSYNLIFQSSIPAAQPWCDMNVWMQTLDPTKAYATDVGHLTHASWPMLTKINPTQWALDTTKDFRLNTIKQIYGTTTFYGKGINVGRILYASQGRDGIEWIFDNDVAAGGCVKAMFNHALSNGNWEPQFTNGKMPYYIPGINVTSGAVSAAQVSPLDSQFVYFDPNGPIPANVLPITDPMRIYARPIVNGGKFTRSPVSQCQFSIPFYSGTFGCLMPNTMLKYIPMRAFQGLTLEFVVSQYGIFTSGYCNSTGNWAQNQPPRSFVITSIELVTTQYVFPPEVENVVMADYNNGSTIYFHTHSFAQGPTTIINKNQIPGNVQVNYGFDSLKAVLVAFIPLDYSNYSWCRRNYRISHNLTKFQAKIGLDYYPAQTIFANGGNVGPISTAQQLVWRKPNNEYIINLLRCFGYYQDTEASSFINSQNFAPNDRPYAPDNCQANVSGNPDSCGYLYQECFNQLGWPLVHENRCRGQALYALDLETLSKSTNMLSGVNTVTNKPFDLLFEYQSDNASLFTRTSQMFIMLWYDMVTAASQAGLQKIGQS
jgi:hypothetical protein